MTEAELRSRLERLGTYLIRYINENRGFRHRTFYGETFSLLFLKLTDQLTPQLRDLLVHAYTDKPKADPEFHWEFNNYALLKYKSLTSDESVHSLLTPLRFKYTLSTNWKLLRLHTSWLAGEDHTAVRVEASKILRQRQSANGQIWDGKRDRSFQYHAFSVAMVGELFRLSGDPFLRERFEMGVKFIRHFVLANGDSLYVGRGQQQLFGYASLAYALALGQVILGDRSLGNELEKVLNRVASFQRADGSFPLVFNPEEYASSTIPDQKNPAPGWYPYNNLFDYLPFAAYLLAETATLLDSAPPAHSRSPNMESVSCDGTYLKATTTRYQAVVSKPGGLWVNDLPFPYVVYKDQSLFPCYGSLSYLAANRFDPAFPYPYHTKKPWSLRNSLLSSTLSKSRLTLVSPLGILRRNFSFAETTFNVSTRLQSPFGLENQFVFKKGVTQKSARVLEDQLFRIESTAALRIAGTASSASGSLVLYRAQANVSLRVTLL